MGARNMTFKNSTHCGPLKKHITNGVIILDIADQE